MSNSENFPHIRATDALFLDFDGTLAPIQDDPHSVALPVGGADTLLALAEQLDGALVAISGRDIRDLSERLPVEIWRAGGHGVDIVAPGEAPPQSPQTAPGTLLADVERIARDFPGTWAESKGPVIAIHYRASPDAAGALEDALARLLAHVDGYALQQGKMVMEAKPADAHKGRALESLMARSPFIGRRPIMVGDDTTDEDAMAAAIRAGGTAIKVGPGETVAPHYLTAPDTVWAWLKGAID